MAEWLSDTAERYDRHADRIAQAAGPDDEIAMAVRQAAHFYSAAAEAARLGHITDAQRYRQKAAKAALLAKLRIDQRDTGQERP